MHIKLCCTYLFPRSIIIARFTDSILASFKLSRLVTNILGVACIFNYDLHKLASCANFSTDQCMLSSCDYRRTQFLHIRHEFDGNFTKFAVRVLVWYLHVTLPNAVVPWPWVQLCCWTGSPLSDLLHGDLPESGQNHPSLPHSRRRRNSAAGLEGAAVEGDAVTYQCR